MATIGIPPAPSADVYIGKTVRDSLGSDLQIYGYPIPNNLSSHSYWDTAVAPYSIPDPTLLFDVSDISEDHEVPVVLYVSPNQLASAVTYTFRWYRKRDSKLIFTYQSSIGDPPEGLVWDVGTSTAAWIGWLSYDLSGVATYPQYVEIQENGEYYCEITASGGENFVKYAYFNVKSIPAATHLSDATTDGFSWNVRTSEYFDTSNYIRVGIATSQVTFGQASAPSGILDYVNAPASNSGAAGEGVASGLSADTTYMVYGFAQAANGLYYPAGSDSITTLPDLADWEWASPLPVDASGHIIAGSNYVDFPATQWNGFTDKINAHRSAKGLSTISFTQAVAGNNFLASMVQAAIDAISAIPSRAIGLNYSTVSQGDDVLADIFNNMMDSLNSTTY